VGNTCVPVHAEVLDLLVGLEAYAALDRRKARLHRHGRGYLVEVRLHLRKSFHARGRGVDARHRVQREHDIECDQHADDDEQETHGRSLAATHQQSVNAEVPGLAEVKNSQTKSLRL
jgi:hypothetical protein